FGRLWRTGCNLRFIKQSQFEKFKCDSLRALHTVGHRVFATGNVSVSGARIDMVDSATAHRPTRRSTSSHRPLRWLDAKFEMSKRESGLRQEILAGLTTFS